MKYTRLVLILPIMHLNKDYVCLDLQDLENQAWRGNTPHCLVRLLFILCPAGFQSALFLKNFVKILFNSLSG